MCGYCGCRHQPAIAELSDEHDRIQDLAHDLEHLARTSDHRTMCTLLDDHLAPLLQHHTDKEERGLFKQLRSCWEADDRLDTLVQEHRDIEDHLRQVRSGGPTWRQAVGQLVAELSQHILDEEVDLFPYALYELRPSQWDALTELHARLAKTPNVRVSPPN